MGIRYSDIILLAEDLLQKQILYLRSATTLFLEL